ncbi:MAG: hypothetical protein JWN41_1568 [Thermoleophilia bacterium]|nr:hypothetical protein [Thermoleophilia bacterium]
MSVAAVAAQSLPTRRPRHAQILPMQASVGAHLAGPRWLFIVGGAALGAMLFGVPGALLGAVGGYLLTR